MAGGSELLSRGNRLHAILLEAAREEGFPLVGALDLDRAAEAFAPHTQRYDRWVAEGNQGAMSYLERGRERRADPRIVMPGAKAMLCVARPYRRKPAGRLDPAEGPRYARYLEGPDYHDTMVDQLERVMARVRASCVAEGLPAPTYKVCVDTSAVLERSWAALAGLGWIGKNTLLIHPKLGSYLFLGEVLIDQEVDAGPAPLPDLCGHCTRCLDGCPTKAIVEPHWLDSRRCISYLTLEKRGAFEAPAEILEKTGSWIAGCDICQEVCPFNLKPSKEPQPEPADLGAISKDTWDALENETEDEYRARVKGSSLSRVKPEQFRRNLEHARKRT